MTDGGGTTQAVEGRGLSLYLVDDHELVAQMLLRALSAEDDFHVVGTAGSFAELRAGVAATRPDVVLMDYRLPDGTGLDATRWLKAEVPNVEVVMLTAHDDVATLAAAMEAGCSGFAVKGSGFDSLVETIRRVARGEVVAPPALLAQLASHLRPRTPELGADLTARELEVLQMLARGRSTQEITETLYVSIHTVRNHIRNIMMKLQATSRLQAVAVAGRLGLVNLSERG